MAENQLRDRVHRAVRSSGPASAHISSFPFLGRLAVAGQVSQVEIKVEGITVGRLRLASVGVVLHDVRFDRGLLLSDRRVVLRAIGSGTATAQISQADIAQLTGVPIRLEKGRATVTIDGSAVSATATVSGNVLHLQVAGQSVPAISIPKIPLLPCVNAVEVVEGFVRLTCRLSTVPVELAGRRVEVQL